MEHVLKSSKPIVFFSKENCVYCDLLQTDLESLEVPYEKVMLTDNIREEIINTTKFKSVPQIFVDKQFIGGYREFSILAANEAKFNTILKAYNLEAKYDF
jgi:glutaredoxin